MQWNRETGTLALSIKLKTRDLCSCISCPNLSNLTCILSIVCSLGLSVLFREMTLTTNYTHLLVDSPYPKCT
ncbi:hypothetical protein L207DRAFT_140219 [Hyaloscypha variabilis F]|uniref:Uncharacterized protein n=1 Tax=Hyaloscypha variabilis (strain UAMH 11265 / GT02V1 / F) TaxID=1149755 RepID=A0A2J6R7A4_HYAVF|nr:hypothetical protein L207DRAFT_140219 [Hyaloscypha variabilis F]